MTLALGIDIGTSGVRVVAMDRGGGVVAMSHVPMAAPQRDGAAVTQDADVWWAALEAALHGMADQVEFAHVRAIAIDGTSGTIVPVDRAGAPLAAATMYNDASASAIAAGFARLAPPETASLGATSPLARAIAIGRPAALARILHQADWVAGRLLGRFDLSDENNALKTGYDPVARRWPDWIASTGLDPALLPEVRPAGAPYGAITPAMARHFGLPADVLIVAGTTDGCAAFLATGASAAGDGVTSLGTTLTLKLLSARPVFAPEYGIYSHRIGDTWLAGGASNTGGAALLAHFTAAQMTALEPALDPATPTGFDYYPLAAAGERFPVNDPAFRPRVSPRPASDAVYFQGLLEGIAAVEALGYRRLAELGATPLASLRSLGGGAANAAWTTIRQRALSVPFLPSPSLEAAAGTARLAWRGLGVL